MLTVAKLDSLKRDSTVRLTEAGNFETAANGTEQLTVVENDLVKVTFTNKGGQPKSIELKKYKSYDSSNVVLGGTPFDNLSYTVNTAANQSAQIANLFFANPVITKKADGNSKCSTHLSAADGKSITHQFIIKPNNYMIDWNIVFNGANQLLTGNALNLVWQVEAEKQQSDIKYERTQSKLCYVEDGSYDYTTAATGATTSFDKQVKWVSVKQQFFNSTLIAKNNFNGGDIGIVVVTDDTTDVVGKATANMKLQLPATALPR